MQRRGNDALNAQLVDGNGRADNIDNRIYAADLVKMHLLDGDTMHAGFGLAQTRKDFVGPLFDLRG